MMHGSTNIKNVLIAIRHPREIVVLWTVR